jgi:hypothetical protein
MRATNSASIFAPNYTWITFEAGGTNTYALHLFKGGIYTHLNSLPQSVVTNSGYSFSSTAGGIVDSSGNLVAKAEVEPTLVVGKVPVSMINHSWDKDDAAAANLGLSAGTVSFDYASKTLKLDGVTLFSSGQLVKNRLSGLSIETTGTTTIKSGGDWPIILYANTNFTGTGTLKVEATNGNFSGVRVNNSADVTVKMGELHVTGAYYGWSGASGGTLTLSKYTTNTSVKSDYYFKGTNHGALNAKKLVLTDMDFWSGSDGTPGCYFDESQKFVCQNGGAIVKGENVVNFFKLDDGDKYPIFVGGTQVTWCNKDGVGSKYITAGGGTAVKWNNSDRILTLNNVTLKTTASGVKGISVGSTLSGDLTVNITGENSITSADDAFYMNKNTTFSGDGKAEFISTAESGLSGAGGACPTFTLLQPIKFQGKKYGYWGTGSSNEVMTIKKTDSGGFVRFSGETAAIHNLTDLTLNNVDFVSQAGSTENLLGCYFDSEKKKVMQNGGVVAKGAGKFVAFGYVSERYDLYVGEVQVNDRNAAGIGSPNITAGGGTAAVYDATNKKLTLNGAKIEATNGTYGNCIRVSSSFDGNFTLNVAGNSTLTSDVSGKSCFYIESKKAPTTITGSGKLTIGGSTTSGIVAWSNLTLDNVEMEMANSLGGGSNSSTNPPALTVKLTTAGRKVTVNGTVSRWSELLLSGGTKVVNPGDWDFRNSSSLDKQYWGIYSKSTNALASPVVFGDQNAAGIEGIVADPNAEVIGIFDAQGRRLEEMQPGINILRMSDGTTRKVIKK